MIPRTSVGLRSIRVFSTQAAVVQDHLAVIDVIAKSPPAKTQPVLAGSLGDALELSHGVLSTAVVGIGA